MLIPSANDAAEALALHVGRGSADRFVGLMNAKAEELGLSDTHFENPHGLDEAGHVSSARDATTLVRYALGVPFIRDALSRSSVSLPGGRTFATTDDLLGTWAPLVGGKTGHTRDAGWSQTAAAERAGVTVYGAVLGSDSRAARNAGASQSCSRSGSTSTGASQVIDRGRVYATAKTGYGKPDVELVAPRCDRPSDSGREAARRARRRADVAWRFRSRRDSGSAGSRSSTGVASSRRRTSSRRRRSRTPASSRRRSGMRPRRRGTCGRWSRDRHRDDERSARPDAHGARCSRSASATDRARCSRSRAARASTSRAHSRSSMCPVVATGLAGGRTGTRIIEELTSEAILNDFVRIAAESRTSTAVVDPDCGDAHGDQRVGPGGHRDRARRC